jgi:dihydroorotate dehydrogenase electron transfer subunit
MIGGGVGPAPILFLNQRLPQSSLIYNYFGARNKNQLPDLTKLSGKTFLATDDGSVGFKGNVVENFKQNLASIPQPFTVYACGPIRMLYLSASARAMDLTTYSLENIMAADSYLPGVLSRMLNHPNVPCD